MKLPRTCATARPQLAKADTAFQGASVGQPTEPCLARRVDGIFLSDFQQGEIGQDLFRHACLMGLEGLVSKHRDRPYRTGRSPRWIKVKNRQHPAFSRVQDQF